MFLDMTEPDFLQKFDTEDKEIHDWFFEDENKEGRRKQFTEIQNR